MGLPRSGDAASRFSAYVEGLTAVIGHADRAKPLRDYCVGPMKVVVTTAIAREMVGFIWAIARVAQPELI